MTDEILSREVVQGEIEQSISPALPTQEQYTLLRSVTTTAATPSEVAFENIKYSMTLGYKFLHELPGFKTPKGKDARIALVGGGPSLKNHLDTLREFDVIIACGSVHDYLVTNGIIPTFATACDPDPITANYYTKLSNETTYLMATACDQKVFDVLEGYDVVLWHCYSDANAAKFKEVDPNFQAIGGGCTVGLRSISIAIMLGYTNIHFFGFDSSLGDGDEHHAYDFVDEKEIEGMGIIYKIKLGNNEGPTSREYKVAGYHLAQARHYMEFYLHYGNMFTSTFHGDGLLPALDSVIKEDIIKGTQL